jgi:hypothetical protein
VVVDVVLIDVDVEDPPPAVVVVGKGTVVVDDEEDVEGNVVVGIDVEAIVVVVPLIVVEGDGAEVVVLVVVEETIVVVVGTAAVLVDETVVPLGTSVGDSGDAQPPEYAHRTPITMQTKATFRRSRLGACPMGPTSLAATVSRYSSTSA